MHLFSSSFAPYARIPSRYALGEPDAEHHVKWAANRNPHLVWGDVPQGTKSFALIVVDFDCPSIGDDVNQEGRTVAADLPRVPFTHWVLVDVPATTRIIEEGSCSDGLTAKGKPPGASPTGGVRGVNDYTSWFSGNPDMEGVYAGYDGCGPPWNDERIHGYRFQLTALDVPSLGLSGPFTRDDVLAAMEGHVLATAEHVGLYSIFHPA